jgi:hypothetical protein
MPAAAENEMPPMLRDSSLTRRLWMIALLLPLLFTGCEKSDRVSRAPSTALRGVERLRTELSFGSAKPDGSHVTPGQWTKFLNEEITPVFPAGLTVIEAHGQYRTLAGELQREQTRIVILVHADAPALEKAIETIIASYKKQFQQEAVLWTTTPVKVR